MDITNNIICYIIGADNVWLTYEHSHRRVFGVWKGYYSNSGSPI